MLKTLFTPSVIRKFTALNVQDQEKVLESMDFARICFEVMGQALETTGLGNIELTEIQKKTAQHRSFHHMAGIFDPDYNKIDNQTNHIARLGARITTKLQDENTEALLAVFAKPFGLALCPSEQDISRNDEAFLSALLTTIKDIKYLHISEEARDTIVTALEELKVKMFGDYKPAAQWNATAETAANSY